MSNFESVFRTRRWSGLPGRDAMAGFSANTSTDVEALVFRSDVPEGLARRMAVRWVNPTPHFPVNLKARIQIFRPCGMVRVWFFACLPRKPLFHEK